MSLINSVPSGLELSGSGSGSGCCAASLLLDYFSLELSGLIFQYLSLSVDFNCRSFIFTNSPCLNVDFIIVHYDLIYAWRRIE